MTWRITIQQRCDKNAPAIILIVVEDKLCVCECVCSSPNDLGAVPQNLHVDVAGPIGVRHNVDLIELNLRRVDYRCLCKKPETKGLVFLCLAVHQKLNEDRSRGLCIGKKLEI